MSRADQRLFDDDNAASSEKRHTNYSKAGHAYACAALGRVRNEEGATAEALDWWRKAIRIAAIPEAAYNLGVHTQPTPCTRASDLH